MEEVWKDIEGFEGYYQVSNLGRVRSLDRIIIFDNGKSKEEKTLLKGKILCITKQTQGYSQVGLCKQGTQKSYRLNRLVANAFIPKIEGKIYVNHIDGDKDNNRVDNLEWVTNSENINHAYRTGLLKHWTRAVLKIDDYGNIIKEYGSLKEAAEDNNTVKSNICLACKVKQKKAIGYYWRYKE